MDFGKVFLLVGMIYVCGVVFGAYVSSFAGSRTIRMSVVGGIIVMGALGLLAVVWVSSALVIVSK